MMVDRFAEMIGHTRYFYCRAYRRIRPQRSAGRVAIPRRLLGSGSVQGLAFQFRENAVPIATPTRRQIAVHVVEVANNNIDAG